MSDGIEALKAAYVSQMQRVYYSSIWEIATPEDRRQWEADADRVIRKVKAEAWDEGFDAGYGIAWAKITAGYEGECPNSYRGGQ